MSENSRIFMKLTSPSAGHIKGECSVDAYEEWIELDSWDWSLGRAKEEDAIPEPSVLSVTKLMDRSSTAMLQAMLKGEKLGAQIFVDDASVDLLFELEIVLEELTFKDYSFSTSISDKGATVDETWAFDYRTITFNHEVNSEHKTGKKTAKFERPQGASTETAGSVRKAELKKLGVELLSGGVLNVVELKDLWAEIVKAHEEEKNRPDGKPLEHGGKASAKAPE